MRPRPPVDTSGFSPAFDVLEWVKQEIIATTGSLHNPDHEHLADADFQFLWATPENKSKGRIILGQAEKVMFNCGGWKRARQEQQMQDWFGEVPAFLITLDARWCAECSDLEFCALVEHELYHLSQAIDEFGEPRFNREAGLPVIAICGHDVEEFVGVVRRYGANADVQKLVDAAGRRPEVANVDIARACGTCLLRAA